MDNRSQSSGGGRHRPGSKKSGGRGHSSSQRGRGRGGAGSINNNRDRGRRQQQESEQSLPSPVRQQLILPGAQQSSVQISIDGRRKDGHENNSSRLHTADMLIGSNSASTSAVGALGEPPSTATDCMAEFTSQMERCGGGNNNNVSADYLEEVAATDTYCASCGVAEVDDIKLKKCPDCDLVQYCSDECQQEHRPRHGEMCRERVAQLRDEMLFRQLECTYFGDCPICLLPLPLDVNKTSMQSCCSKIICKGCAYANIIRQREGRLQQTCPFCRHPTPKTDEEIETNNMKRAAANDPVAIREVGAKRYYDGDYDSAFEYFTKAAGLGDIDAHFQLSVLYREGQGVEKDEKMELYHLEEAVIAGHPFARHNLAYNDAINGTLDRAAKHLIIAANHGYDGSIKKLKDFYVNGVVSKEEFAAALRAHQAAVDATKSAQRELAASAEAAGVW